MTEYDARNYLEKIYNLPIKSLKSVIRCGKIRSFMGELDKVEDDYRMVYVTLPIGCEFRFPDIEQAQLKNEEDQDREKMVDKISDRKEVNLRADVPNWFGI